MSKENNIKKLEEIERYGDDIPQHVDRLIQLCKDKNDEIRYRALESLQEIQTPEVKDCVYEALADTDEMVVVTSLEILAYWEDRTKESEIIDLLTDDRALVRHYAASAIGLIGLTEGEYYLFNRLEICEDDEENLRIHFALYMLGNHEYLFHFLNGIFHSFYRIRCATANLLTYMITKDNKDFLGNLLSEVLINEETVAAGSSIKGAIDYIKYYR